MIKKSIARTSTERRLARVFIISRILTGSARTTIGVSASD